MLFQFVRYQVHNALVWKNNVQPLVLSEPARQRQDTEFFQLLQQVVEGEMPSKSSNFELPLISTSSDVDKCQKFVHPHVACRDTECPLDSAILVATNLYVDKHNQHLQNRNPTSVKFSTAPTLLMPDKTEILLTDANFDFGANKSEVPTPTPSQNW